MEPERSLLSSQDAANGPDLSHMHSARFLTHFLKIRLTSSSIYDWVCQVRYLQKTWFKYVAFRLLPRNSYCPPAGRSCMTQRQAVHNLSA
jgi:hypothetical protein